MIRDGFWVAAAIVVVLTIIAGFLFAGLVVGTLAGFDMSSLPR